MWKYSCAASLHTVRAHGGDCVRAKERFLVLRRRRKSQLVLLEGCATCGKPAAS